METNQEKILAQFYDSLFNVLSRKEAGSESDQIFFNLNWPGQVIDISQFANPWSPKNPDGDQQALENLSDIVDPIPFLSVGYVQSGKTVSAIHGLVVNANITPEEGSESAKKKYIDATNYLESLVDNYDDTGKIVKVKGDSDIYARYKLKKDAYNKALLAFNNAYLSFDMSKPEDQRKWSLLGPTYQNDLDTARKDWESAHKTQVEDKLAILAQSSHNQVGVLFSDAKSKYEQYKRKSIIDPAKTYLPSYARPANWFVPKVASSWNTMELSSEKSYTLTESEFVKYSVKGQASWGLWSVGGNYSDEKSHESLDEKTSDIKIKFKYTRVEIDRPWYNGLLYNVGGWEIPQVGGPGCISDGTKVSNGLIMPILPTAFIAVRDVEISGNWGEKDQKLIKEKMTAGADFGWGPFKISGSYEKSEQKQIKSSTFDGQTIKLPELQIIGWINSVVPYSPHNK